MVYANESGRGIACEGHVLMLVSVVTFEEFYWLLITYMCYDGGTCLLQVPNVALWNEAVCRSGYLSMVFPPPIHRRVDSLFSPTHRQLPQASCMTGATFSFCPTHQFCVYACCLIF